MIGTEIQISRHDSNIIKIFPDKDLISKVDDYFHYYNADEVKIQLYELGMTDDGDPFIKLGAGYFDQLIKLLIMNDYTPKSDSSVSLKSLKIEINERWKAILNTDFRVRQGKNQYEHLLSLINFSRACGQFHTGFGKTELFLAIAESYMEQYDKNVVILVPDNTIKKEFLSRAEKWNMPLKPEYSTFKSRFQLINPTGLAKNKVFKTGTSELHHDYFKNVGLVLIDELHHLPAPSYTFLMDVYLKWYDAIYGGSGTIDASNGIIPTLKMTPKDFGTKMNKIIKYVGLPRTVVRNDNKIEVSYLRAHFGAIPEKLKGNYRVCLNLFLGSKLLPNYIQKFLFRHPTRKLYLPVHEVKAGQKLRASLVKLFGHEDSVILWTGKGYIPDTITGKTSLNDHIDNNPHFKVLISSTVSYEGYDNSSLDTILLSVGSSNRMTLQPAGRIGRGSVNTPMVIFPYDTKNSNRILNKQSRERYALLKSEFENLKFISLGDFE